MYLVRILVVFARSVRGNARNCLEKRVFGSKWATVSAALTLNLTLNALVLGTCCRVAGHLLVLLGS